MGNDKLPNCEGHPMSDMDFQFCLMEAITLAEATLDPFLSNVERYIKDSCPYSEKQIKAYECARAIITGQCSRYELSGGQDPRRTDIYIRPKNSQ